MTWFANGLILTGLFLVGGKRRAAFLFTLAGELIWCAAAVLRGQWDLASICAVFAGMAAVNWHRWGKDKDAVK